MNLIILEAGCETEDSAIGGIWDDSHIEGLRVSGNLAKPMVQSWAFKSPRGTQILGNDLVAPSALAFPDGCAFLSISEIQDVVESGRR